jgi:putative sterol carrier protein
VTAPVPFPAFSEAWARACADALNLREAYRAAAATWEGAILLVLQEDSGGGAQRIFLDLWHGECRAARVAGPEDEEAARYVLSGARTAWEQVLTGRVAPLFALVSGRLRLAKGNIAELLPYVGAARELVAAVATVSATFALD